jgi:hypothetical protein
MVLETEDTAARDRQAYLDETLQVYANRELALAGWVIEFGAFKTEIVKALRFYRRHRARLKAQKRHKKRDKARKAKEAKP